MVYHHSAKVQVDDDDAVPDLEQRQATPQLLRDSLPHVYISLE
jgi:hypothetical protein